VQTGTSALHQNNKNKCAWRLSEALGSGQRKQKRKAADGQNVQVGPVW
jgi:hypothetical protein